MGWFFLIRQLEIKQGLEICLKTANYLKEKYPNELMKIRYDTILPYETKNKKCHSKGMGNYYAFYNNRSPARIIIKQKVLIEKKVLRTKIKNQNDRVLLNGNFALIELMVHELSHHRTKRHARGFKIKYNKFMSVISLWLISGNFYNGDVLNWNIQKK